MAEIDVGDFVECMRGDEHPKAPGIALNEGAIYQVGWLGDGQYKGRAGDGLRVVNDPLPKNCAWRVEDFRPIYRPRNSTLIADLTKTPAGAEA